MALDKDIVQLSRNCKKNFLRPFTLLPVRCKTLGLTVFGYAGRIFAPFAMK